MILYQNLLSAEERRLLLHDISNVALALGEDLGAPIGTVPDVAAPPRDVSPLERLHLIDALWPRILSILTALARAGMWQGDLRPIPTPTPLPCALGGPK